MRSPNLLSTTLLFAAWTLPHQLLANPNGLTVQSGTVTTATQGSHLTVNASHNAFLHWQSFNIDPGQTTTFVQPSSSSVVWNSIHDANPSQIWGRLDANGVVVLMNPAGFHFGPDSVVSAAGLVVSTAPVGPVESGAGLFWSFQGAPPSAPIVNYGRLEVGEGGSAFLIADRIENHGDIHAPGGTIGLYAGKEVLISERPDGRGLSAEVRLPEGSVNNAGRLVADAGSIALHARVVNQSGSAQANTVLNRNGIIEFAASDSLHLTSSSSMEARGNSQSPGGGTISLQSAGRFADAPGSRLDVSGGPAGDGGLVAISAPSMAAIHSHLNGSAGAGQTGGRLVIDPLDIVIGNSGDGSLGPDGTVNAGDEPETLFLDVQSAFVGFSQIRLQAARNLTLASGTVWDLEGTTGITEPGSHLHLEAGNNLTLANGSRLLGGEHWSITLEAGRDLATPDVLKAGVGDLALAGSALLQTGQGNVLLRAGNHVTVASGAVRTTAGGRIDVEALSGNIVTGTRANGFLFRPTGYVVDPELGGISTAAGGDVILTAGQDVISFLPLPGGNQTDAGSGAFGAEPGQVTITAGRDVAGHFVARNGQGTITAGRNAGTPSRLLALSLVKGGWTVNAAQDLLLQEVRNPNGVFNNLGSSTSANRHRFDYAPDTFVSLTAGNAVQLRGTALPRYLDAFSQGMPPIYPGILTVQAGAGGVVLGNDLILFPTPLGHLRVVTTDGGSVTGTKQGDLAQWVLSNSGRTQYRAFGDFGLSDHGTELLHRDHPDPVEFDIAGDLSNLIIGSAKRAEIRVGGNMINARFEGQNLRAEDVTRIVVAGDLRNRSEFTSAPLPNAPDFSAFDWAYPPLTGSASGMENLLFYNPVTKVVTFQGRMSGDQLDALLNLSVQVFDANGFPLLAPNGEPLTQRVQVLPPEVAQDLYARSQDIPQNPDSGYRLGGGGRFEIAARSIDLGATAGIVTYGPRANPALAQEFLRGADIQVRTEGDLNLFSTSISTRQGGSIDIVSGGGVTVGSGEFFGNDLVARGIFTVDPSDVSVIARGDIQVSGSRIAAYDGGNVLVRSLEGNVNAGTGGSGAVAVEKITVEPETRTIATYTPTIPGSGILATSFPNALDPAFPPSIHPVGNIRVETPQGNIQASAGGIVQIPLNGVGATAGTVHLVAGSKDAEGNVLYVGNIDASGSGIIGGTVSLEASGDIRGLVFARENIELSAQQSVNVTALAQGGVSVSAGGNVSGTLIGVGSVSASGGGTVDAALLSQNVSASGEVASSQVGFAQGTAAAAASQSVATEDTATSAVASTERDDDELRRRTTAATPQLMRTTGRVTVILP